LGFFSYYCVDVTVKKPLSLPQFIDPMQASSAHERRDRSTLQIGSSRQSSTATERFAVIDSASAARIWSRNHLPLEPKIPEKIHWVQPKLVCEVAFAEWTEDEQLRQTTFLGWRDDKSPEEVALEGNIHSLVTVNDPEGKGVLLASRPGQFVAEVEGLELTPEKANFSTLREIAASHVVKKPLPRCRLVKKQQ
jgi:ATP dependent DNA ligase C terminal region